jgi:hypothetical protein
MHSCVSDHVSEWLSQIVLDKVHLRLAVEAYRSPGEIRQRRKRDSDWVHGTAMLEVVEHVHVHAGGQAIVGTVETPGGGDQPKSEDQPHAKEITHAPEPAMWRTDEKRKSVPVGSDAERPMPIARRTVPRRSEG